METELKKNMETGLEKLKEIYFNDSVCMGNILATVKCSEMGDLTLEQAHDLYEQALDWSGDEVVSVFADNESEEN